MSKYLVVEAEDDKLSFIGKNKMGETCYEEIPLKISSESVELTLSKN